MKYELSVKRFFFAKTRFFADSNFTERLDRSYFSLVSVPDPNQPQRGSLPVSHAGKEGLVKLLHENIMGCSMLASFSDPAQLFVARSTEKRGEPGMFPHVSIT